MADQASLAQQVQELQRTNPVAKEQWMAFTTTRGGGTRNPARHEAALLQEFLNGVLAGTSFAAPAKPTPMGGASPYASMAAMGGGGDFAGQVKELQKSDPNAKEQWNNFADTKGSGVRDPARHTPEFLQEFLFALAQGQTFGGQVATGAGGLAEVIKSLQKKSASFKQIWGSFCMTNGGGRMDPAKHDHALHVQFFESLAGAANGASMMGGGMMAGPDMNPAKRARTGMPVAAAMGMMGMGAVSAEKEQLVARIKNYQKTGTEEKELWNVYVDTYLGRNRDPNRHDEATLKEFCENHGVPDVAMPAGGGAGMGGMGGMGGLMFGGSPLGGMAGMMGGMGGGMSGEMAALVEKVKAFQKGSPENKEAWGEFAGKTKDPSRHEESKLQEFCGMYGL